MPKRHALLVAYLLFSGQQLRDELATMYIRVVGRWFNKADKRHWQHFQSNGRAINRKLHDFMRLSKALLQARAQMRDLGGAVAATIGWERLAEGVEETEELAVPLDFSNLDQLRAQYGQVRQFSPQLLRTLEFRSIPRLKPLMRAVDVLRALNENEKSEVPRRRSERVHPAVLAAVCPQRKEGRSCLLRAVCPHRVELRSTFR